MTEPASATPGTAPGTVSLADEEGVMSQPSWPVVTPGKAIVAIREHHAHWLRDQDGLGALTSAGDGG